MLPYWLYPAQRNIKWKKAKDPVYDYVYFNEIEKAVLDHPLTQRLRYICQLQLARLVYPSAEHSRFQHSLGVMHIMGIISSKVLSKLKDEEKLTPRDFETLVLASRIAGLLHDIGHIFLSHWAEEYLLGMASEIGFYSSHEVIGNVLYQKFYKNYFKTYLQSRKSIENMIDINLLIQAVDALMTPLVEPVSLSNILKVAEQSLSSDYKQFSIYIVPLIQALRGWLYTADELDYIMRDGRSAGVSGYGTIDWLRMLEETEACELKLEDSKEMYVLCVKSWRKFSPAFLKYLDSYLSLYRYCYLHKSSKAFERLLGKIIERNSQYFVTLLGDLKKAIESSSDIFDASYELLKFTDSIQIYNLIEISRSKREEKEWIKKFMAREQLLKCIFETYIWCQNYQGFINLKNIIKNMKEKRRREGEIGLLKLFSEMSGLRPADDLFDTVTSGQILFGEISFVKPKILNYDENDLLVIEKQREPIVLNLREFCEGYLVPSLGRIPSFAKILVFTSDEFEAEKTRDVQETMTKIVKKLCENYRYIYPEIISM